ncbi:hypothetical protein MCOR25_004875 [Pyricularia grisea]|nr:hypothetical protein MCOR25_004875 [Pyricularia grisea]
MDLEGPSMTILTACSSWLVGLNEACMAIAKGDYGYARGEGIVSLYVKSLSAAIRDRNSIRAVISGATANFDGRTNPLLLPSAINHEALIRRAYEHAGIRDVSRKASVECHGTVTAAGDRLEAEAVASVFGREGIYMGAIKPNLGHSEGASGLTAVIKPVVAVEHRIIPPNIKFAPLNPQIPFAEAKLQIPEEPTPWPADRDERVSNNAFGIGGSNAHIIIESRASYLASRSRPHTDARIIQDTSAATITGTNSDPQLLLF